VSASLGRVLVVDDGSKDGTLEIVARLADEFPGKVDILARHSKQGLGKAYTRGYRYGQQLGVFDAFLTLDADFSHEPKSIPSLLAALDDGADYVIGSRYVKGGGTSDSWPLLRLLQSRLANFLARELGGLKDEVKDLTSGFRAIKPAVLSQLSLEEIPASGYVYLVSILYELSGRGFKIKEVPIIFEERRWGQSKLKLRDMIEFLFLAYRLNPNSRARRILRFGLVGACGTLVNLAVLAICVNVFKLSPLVAVATAIEISITSNFFMNHLYTFRYRLADDAAVISKLLKYNIIALGGATITYGLFAFGYKSLHLHYLIADLVAIALAMFWNYVMSVMIVWKVVDKDVDIDDNKDSEQDVYKKTVQAPEIEEIRN